MRFAWPRSTRVRGPSGSTAWASRCASWSLSSRPRGEGAAAVWAWLGVGVLVLVFVRLMVVHARVDRELTRAAAAQRFHERGLARLDRAWDRLRTTSERFRTPGHPFADDLDVFGRASLMQLVDATETRLGEVIGWRGGSGRRRWRRGRRWRRSSPDMQAARDLGCWDAFRRVAGHSSGGVFGKTRPTPRAPAAVGRVHCGAAASSLCQVAWVSRCFRWLPRCRCGRRT